MRALMVTDYARQWFQQKLQAGRMILNWDYSYCDMGCVEIVEEVVRIPFTSGR